MREEWMNGTEKSDVERKMTDYFPVCIYGEQIRESITGKKSR